MLFPIILTLKMKLQKIKIGDKVVMPFTIPSGIVMTDPRCAARILQMNPIIGIWTTKSIGPEPRRGNREPIFAKYAPGSYVNAVGLANPGCEKFRKVRIPSLQIHDNTTMYKFFRPVIPRWSING
mgnify:CR=1 FL=1